MILWRDKIAHNFYDWYNHIYLIIHNKYKIFKNDHTLFITQMKFVQIFIWIKLSQMYNNLCQIRIINFQLIIQLKYNNFDPSMEKVN